MDLSFLPEKIKKALAHLNINLLTEIRIRRGQAVKIEYMGSIQYLVPSGSCSKNINAICCNEVESILYNAMKGSVYAYSEQLKRAFITVDGGVRIGVCGQYVTNSGSISAITNVTSLNIRIPHDVADCADIIYKKLFYKNISNVIIFSPPGLGKTTIIRSLIKKLSITTNYNILVFDERNEIAACSKDFCFNLGDNVDVVSGGDKLSAFSNAIRAMRPQIIATDELYGEDDFKAIKIAIDCAIKVIATTHITDRKILCSLPFDYFIELVGIGDEPIIYDKNFNIICNNSFNNSCGIPVDA
jgi:stage III sporulation protein AA